MDLKQTVATELHSARQRSLSLLEPLSDHDLRAQHSHLMSPLVWDLAHVGHYEELWLIRNLTGAPPTCAEYDDIYDAFKHPRRERPSLPILGPADARTFVADVRARALDVLDHAELDSALLRNAFVYGMVVQHEHQHDETMLATVQLRDTAYPVVEDPQPHGRPLGTAEVFVDAGPFVMGTDLEPWAYDNERPAHEVDLDAFWIDTAPVTNADFAAFVADGGYDRRVWWTDGGWAWRSESALEHPQFWMRDGAGWWLRTRLGAVEVLPADEPVQHVCWYEADAYARWAGKRLPTETEWEKAASWDPASGRKRRYPWGDEPPRPDLANLGQRRLGPDPVGSHPLGVSPYGCHQMVGDVWEWTSSDFEAYPGFASFPYREYSEVFFGSDFKVLRGGSWATHPLAMRTTFRNWDYPIRRQIFAGFRCARDAGR